MRRLLLAALFAASSQGARAEFCSELTGSGPCTPDDTDETRTIKRAVLKDIARAKRDEPAVKSLKTDYLRVRDGPDRAVALASLEKYRAAQIAQNQLYRDAIEKTEALYHVYPTIMINLVVAKPSDPKMEWMSGLTANWNPQAIDSGPGTKLAVKIWGTDDNEHYGGFADMNPEPDDPRQPAKYAATLPDGRVFILKGTLNLAAKKRDLGFLASVIFHETRHFNQLSRGGADESARSRSWATQEEDERDAYAEQNRLADVFQLNPEDKKKFLRAGHDYALSAKTAATSWNPDPQTGSDWKGVYDGEIPVNGEQQINLEEEYKRLKSEVERAKHQQQEESSPSMNPGAVAMPAQLAEPDPRYPAATPAQLAESDSRSAVAPRAHLLGEGAQAAARAAQQACAAPQGLSDSTLAGIEWTDSDNEEASKISASLSDCARIVFDKIVQTLRGGRGLNAAFVRGFIPTPQKPVFAPRQGDRDDQDLPSRHSPDDWRSLRQLRGLNR